MVNMTALTLFPYFLTAICGLLAIFGICVKITKVKYQKVHSILNFIGNNTLSILTWHMSAFLIVSKLIICCYNLNPRRLAEFPVIKEYASGYWGGVYFIVSMFVCCVIIYMGKLLNLRLLLPFHLRNTLSIRNRFLL